MPGSRGQRGGRSGPEAVGLPDRLRTLAGARAGRDDELDGAVDGEREHDHRGRDDPDRRDPCVAVNRGRVGLVARPLSPEDQRPAEVDQHAEHVTGVAIVPRTVMSVCWLAAELDWRPGGRCGPSTSATSRQPMMDSTIHSTSSQKPSRRLPIGAACGRWGVGGHRGLHLHLAHHAATRGAHRGRRCRPRSRGRTARSTASGRCRGWSWGVMKLNLMTDILASPRPGWPPCTARCRRGCCSRRTSSAPDLIGHVEADAGDGRRCAAPSSSPSCPNVVSRCRRRRYVLPLKKRDVLDVADGPRDLAARATVAERRAPVDSPRWSC